MGSLICSDFTEVCYCVSSGSTENCERWRDRYLDGEPLGYMSIRGYAPERILDSAQICSSCEVRISDLDLQHLTSTTVWSAMQLCSCVLAECKPLKAVNEHSMTSLVAPCLPIQDSQKEIPQRWPQQLCAPDSWGPQPEIGTPGSKPGLCAFLRGWWHPPAGCAWLVSPAPGGSRGCSARKSPTPANSWPPINSPGRYCSCEAAALTEACST